MVREEELKEIMKKVKAKRGSSNSDGGENSEDTEDGWEEDTAMIQTKVNYEAKHLHLIYMIFINQKLFWPIYFELSML